VVSHWELKVDVIPGLAQQEHSIDARPPRSTLCYVNVQTRILFDGFIFFLFIVFQETFENFVSAICWSGCFLVGYQGTLFVVL